MGTVRSKDGTTIAYDTWGVGQPLIIVDGSTAYRGTDPTNPEVARLLGDEFRVYAYDRRGRGESTDTAPYAVEREIEDLEALVAEAGGEASVFGMSSGGMLVLDAAQRGVAMAKAVAYEPPLRVSENGPPPIPDYLETLDRRLAGEPGEALSYFLGIVGMPDEQLEAFRNSPVWPAFVAVEHTLAYDGRIMDRFSLGRPIPPGEWNAATQPTLVIAGGESPDWMRESAAAVADALPSGELRTLPGQTHEYEPEVLAPVLLEFLGD